ncbi:MAG: 30S ribosomal protein S3 [Deltaproteobacteria bacterium RIFCSPLOWO2_02_FULL_50_16]|nr:MAG: 30S ribosomal protein S3 [Deltaproteobacteria bacterium RIFCSPHIGHO2_02_FULL_50_15]OGQ56190.1 MAG: 30S ribosomal protein S3 [Deltaproteobacteria bacterium RIFCSPLOWO2_02_FULL_50_16]OGQ67047.1 MAG: 30S ribosomal protein S3 [Deltaproteobacteria bacterium RIFCSPLOWO2_12_FULL_50_11]
MGQKTHPIGFRVGITKPWLARWYAKGNYRQLLHEDIMVRQYVKKKLYSAGVSHIEIERTSGAVRVNIYSARPGLVIGKKGTGIDALKLDLSKMTGKAVTVNIHEVRKAETNAQLVAESVALQLERRIAFRRAMKKAVGSALKFGAEGIKIKCSGRLGGAEIARTEWYREGRIPLHTLRANIDYGFAEANTTYGKIGITTWILCKPEPEAKGRTI